MKIKKLITTIAIGVGLVAPIFNVNHTQVVEAASINSIAKQNSYVGETFLYQMLQTQNIKYNKFYAKGNKIKYRQGTPEGIVIHETATPGASAYNEAIYFNREWMNMYSYVHAFVDSKQVIQMMTPNYGVWGAGAIANNRFIQIELCRENTRNKFAKSVNNDAIYAAKLLHRYNITPVNASNTGKGTVWSHHAVSRFLGGTNHTDPDGYFQKWGYSMNDFFSLLKYYYDLQAAETSNTTVPDNNVGSNDPVVSDSNTDSNTDPVSQAPTGNKTLMHDAYTYDAQGNRTTAALKTAGTVVTVAQEQVINGKKYLQIGENEYVVASNIVGTKRVLTHNAYVYDTTGIRCDNAKLLRGTSVRTYGGRINIGGKMYYPIDTNRFVKAANFK
ncbi:SLAP domain-containing protein [Lactobacillus melliventris]|uniref:SLAP domain-containing protein n=1 Tax=Lactobacillus melliventris TaxID=1218507 RepID=UPI00164F6A2B|nr:SLAP domain-containing protein [Lactobacillus melliventris]MBC6350026.1 amidase [Lactobacillus melliventris]